MTRAFAFLSTAAALLSAVAFGQSTAPQSSASQPTFQLADVHVSPSARNPFLRGPMTPHGLYELRFATMLDLIRTAYGVEAERVLGGPNWLEDDTFDVIAKLPEGMTQETAKPLLQALLADRFHLTVHNDNQPVPAYAIKVAGKHPELKQSGGSGDTGCKLTMPPPPPLPAPGGPPPPAPLFSYACTSMSIAKFAEALTTTIFLAPQYLNDRVVVDETELKGAWDFDLKLTPRGLITPSWPHAGNRYAFRCYGKARPET